MNCIRCEEKPASVTCSCLALARHSDSVSNYATNTRTITTVEYATGIEEAGLCEACVKRIAFFETKVLFPKLNKWFYLIWCALSVVCFVLIFITTCGKGNVNPFGVPAFIGLLALLAALGLYELITRIVAVARRSERDKLLIACAEKYPCKKRYPKGSYVPLGKDFYPDYAAFRRVNSQIAEDNAKKIYENYIAPGSTVSFGDEIKGAFK